MPDINLLHDREAGDNGKDEQQQKRIVRLSNPAKQAPADEAPPKPAGGLGALFRDAMEKVRHRYRTPKPIGKPRILTQELDVTSGPPPKEPEREEPTTVEMYAPATPSPAPAPAPERPTPPEPVLPEQPKQPTSKLEEREAKREQQPTVGPYKPGGSFSNPAEELGGNGAPPDLGVNLVPEEMVEGAGQQNRFVSLGLILGATLLVLGLAFIGLSLFQSRIVQQTQEARDAISQTDTELARLTQAKNDAIRFHNMTEEITNLLGTHIYWTEFFAGLERHTVDTVYFRSFSADQAGRLTLSGSAADYRSVARQLIAFEEATDFVQDVSITSAARSETDGVVSVDFSATITLHPDIFYRDATGASVAVTEAEAEAAP